MAWTVSGHLRKDDVAVGPWEMKGEVSGAHGGVGFVCKWLRANPAGHARSAAHPCWFADSTAAHEHLQLCERKERPDPSFQAVRLLQRPGCLHAKRVYSQKVLKERA